jgi:hypothetical protein
MRLLHKPVPPDELEAAMRDGLIAHREALLRREATTSNERGGVEALCELLSIVDIEALDSGQSIVGTALALAQALEHPRPWHVEIAARLSRLGEVALPESVRAKLEQDTPLSTAEATRVRAVPEVGARLVAHLPGMADVADAIRNQGVDLSEKSGRQRVAPDAAALAARILRVARDLENLEAEGYDPESALVMLQRRGKCYDENVLTALERVQAHDRAQAEAHAYPPREVPVRKLRRDDVLVAPIRTTDGRMLLPAGQTITSEMLERVRNYAKTEGVREPLRIEDWRRSKPTPDAA